MIQLGELAEIEAGANVMRLPESQQDRKYSNADFEYDFYHMKMSSPENKIIYRQSVSEQHQTAAIISERNREKIVSQMFAIIKADLNRLDPWYLCYMLNESDILERQYLLQSQGSVLVRLSSHAIKQLRIPLPEMTVQKRIGRLYATALYQHYLETTKANQKMQGILTILRDMEEK